MALIIGAFLPLRAGAVDTNQLFRVGTVARFSGTHARQFL
jgi:hypothetical protein